MTLNGNNDETNGYNSVIKNGEVTNANLNKAVIPPIGTVLHWLKSFTNTPSLPDGYVECNGQTLSDSDSPYDGQVIPDLNGGNRFLRGNSTSGGTGGSNTHTHTFSGTTDSNGNNSSSNFSGGGNSSPLPHTHSFSGTSDAGSTLPSYYEVVYIMRVK